MTFASSPRPYSSMWGQCDQAEEMFPGIWSVSTPGHGGFVLSKERCQAMPAYLRERLVCSQNGEFEEDSDWALVALAFPDEFRTHRFKHYPEGKTTLDFAIESARVWHPERFAAWEEEQSVLS